MAGLIANLHAGAAALQAHTKNIEIAGKNLANVSNPAYARQRVILADRGQIRTTTGTESTGLEAAGVVQARDKFMDRQVMRELGLTSALTVREQAYSRAEASLDQHLNRADDTSTIGTSPQATGAGLSEALGDFFNSFESLAAKPSDVGERQLLVQKAQILTEKINGADSRLSQLQDDLNTEIADGVSNVNRLLKGLADLNEQIGRAEIGNPGTAVDLRDQRQAQIEELSKYMDIEVREPAGYTGQVQIAAKDSSYGDVVLLDRTSTTGAVNFDGTNFTGGTPPTNLALQTGSMIAQKDARDSGIQDLRNGLKALADQLKTAVNAAYNPSGTTGDFFSSSPSGILTIDPSVTAATLKTSDTGMSGANELALGVARLANQRFAVSAGDAIDGTPSAFLSKITGEIGQDLSSARDQLENQKLLEKFVTDQRDSVSGVSMDEELTDLLKYQRAFQASSRFVNVVDDLLDLVVNRLGH